MTFHQKQTERNITWLLAGICIVSLLAWITNTYPPAPWSILILFILLFAATSSLVLFLLNNVRRAMLIGAGISGIFFLRLIELREPLYIILLVACLVSLELYLKKQ